MAKNELSRLRGLLLADVKAREQILDILNKLEEMDINNTEYIEEISTKLLALNKFSTKEEYEVINNELNNLLSQIEELSEFKNLIPDTATSENKLVDKDFLNSSISTATAEFRGTVENEDVLNSLPADKNDYAFYKHTDESGNTVFDRYKFTDKWEYEYTLNNSSFTAEQWATINSGLTAKVLDDLAADTERELEKKVNYTDIVDALNSEETSKPLSAKMGKELKTQVDTKAELEYVNEELNKKASNSQVDEKINDVKEYVDGTLNNYPTNNQVNEELKNYAKKDGYYETFGYAREAGVAKNLQSDKDKLLDPDVSSSSGAVYADQPFTQRATAMTMKAYIDNELITVGSGYEQWKKEQAFSIVRNQLRKDIISTTNAGLTIATNDKRQITVAGTRTNASTFGVRLSNETTIANHKYFIYFNSKETRHVYRLYTYLGDNFNSVLIETLNKPSIISVSTNGLNLRLALQGEINEVYNDIIDLVCIDLTQWFASRPAIATALNGNAGVKWFLQNYPQALMLGYDEGTIVDTEDYDYETTGVNLWDEEWESGQFDWSTGMPTSNPARYRSKNFIPVMPNTNYYIKANNSIEILFYGVDYQYFKNTSRDNTTFTTPSNCYFLKICDTFSSTYNNDIQICQHFTETSVEQTYHKYEIFKDRVSWAFTSTGKGKSAGSVADTKDYVNKKNIEKVGQVDLGSLTYSYNLGAQTNIFRVGSSAISNIKKGTTNVVSVKYHYIKYADNNYSIWVTDYGGIYIQDNDFYDSSKTPEQMVATFKAAMSGVILNYELATPIETDMSGDELNTNIPENDYGVERKVPVSGDMFSGSATTIFYQDIVWKQIYNNKSLIDNLRVDVDALESRIPGAAENAVSTHNTSSTAHSDIRDLVSTAQTAADNAQTKVNEIEELIVKNGVIDGSPKDVYADLSALQTAFPSGASGVYLTSDNGHWYYWNSSAWTDGGVYQSSEDIKQIKEDLGDKLDKTTERVYIGTIINNKWQQSNGNEYSASNAYYLSANVQPNTKYYATGRQINASFPLVVMFDENNNVIGTKELGESITEYDYEFVTPSNCVKVSVNGEKKNSNLNYSAYPSLYYIQNKDLDGNDLESQINGKQNELSEWRKATYQYEVNKFVLEQGEKAIVTSNSFSNGYKYAKLIYDKNKKYRFFGQCRSTAIPILLCCDENDNVIKIYGSNVNDVLKGEEYNDIPENTYCIYVNGYQLNARVEIKEQRNTTSFESKKIGVCFGDSITQGNNVYISSSITPIYDYPSFVGKTLDCTIYNGGLGGSTYSSGRSIDFKNVCDCIVSGDFSTVIDGISQYGLNASAVLQYNAISKLDFNDVDFISIALGTNDWSFGASAESIKNAMRYCISTLLTAYPHLKIYVFTPIFRFNLNGSGQNSDTYVNTESGLKLHDVCDAIIETTKEFNVPCKDMYYSCNINQYNKDLYMGDDTHPNANGYALIGEKIAKFINSN